MAFVFPGADESFNVGKEKISVVVEDLEKSQDRISVVIDHDEHEHDREKISVVVEDLVKSQEKISVVIAQWAIGLICSPLRCRLY